MNLSWKWLWDVVFCVYGSVNISLIFAAILSSRPFYEYVTIDTNNKKTFFYLMYYLHELSKNNINEIMIILQI